MEFTQEVTSESKIMYFIPKNKNLSFKTSSNLYAIWVVIDELEVYDLQGGRKYYGPDCGNTEVNRSNIDLRSFSPFVLTLKVIISMGEISRKT